MIWIWWMAQLTFMFLSAMLIHILTAIVLVEVYRNRRLFKSGEKRVNTNQQGDGNQEFKITCSLAASSKERQSP
jgi:hypothetical protein